ncbi:MAG: hypothetical protein IH931_01915 [candidate division Zixibacteria bacterium]|nr:hypothetical protein [candidate division Zixibacteria bacterium]
MKIRLISIIVAILALSLAAGWGCNGVLTDTEPGSTFNYNLTGALIQDPNRDSSIVIVKLKRDDADYVIAKMNFGGDVLLFSPLKYGFDSVFSRSASRTSGYSATQMNLIMDDSPFLTDTAFVNVVSSFNIDTTSVTPFTRIIQGTGTASYIWTPSVNTEGYVIVAVKADSAYKGQGYSSFLDFGTTQGTIPADAFVLPVSSDPDTGLYNLYVYSISGSPDSAMTAMLLPTPLPIQYSNNIADGKFTGRFGSIEVSLLDTIRVVTIP